MMSVMDEDKSFDELAVYSDDDITYVDGSELSGSAVVVDSLAAAGDAWSGTGIGSEFSGIQGNIALRNQSRTGLRFRARQAGSLLAVSVHVKGTTFQEIPPGHPDSPPGQFIDGGNYGYGNGGNMRARVFTESGSGPNFANEVARSENKIAIRGIVVGNSNEVLNFNLYKPLPNDPDGVDTSKRLVMTAGAKYHIIFENDATDPINNFASINWGNNKSGPRTLNPPEAWSPYWSDERVYFFKLEKDPNGNFPDPNHTYPADYAESRVHQPAFALKYIPTGTQTQTYWGPINLLSSIKDKRVDSQTGGMVPVNGTIRLRQKFRVENEITVKSTLVAPSFFNPTGSTVPAGILRVTLQDDQEAELARADYGISDSLNMNSTVYVNFWDNLVAGQIYRYVAKALKNAGGTAAPVELAPGIDYFLCFERVVGNVTFMINIGQEPYKPSGGYWTNGNYTPEGWASAATAGDCQAQWATTGSNWATCSLYSANADPTLEVRARLVT